jgi:hypothetical protein
LLRVPLGSFATANSLGTTILAGSSKPRKGLPLPVVFLLSDLKVRPPKRHPAVAKGRGFLSGLLLGFAYRTKGRPIKPQWAE